MNWLFYTFSALIFFTGLNLLQRKIAVKCQNPRAMAILFNSVATLIALTIFFITGGVGNFKLPRNTEAWGALFFACLFYGLFERNRFQAAKLLDASVLAIVMNISSVVTFVGSLVLYSETLTINKIAGGLLIISALFLVSLGKIEKKSSAKGLVIGILVSVLLGLGGMLDKMGAQSFTPQAYNILLWIIPLIFICFPYINIKIIKEELKISTWRVFLLAGLNVSGYLFLLKALEIAEATRVYPIVQTSTLLIVFLGAMFLGEKENMIRKIIAGTMVTLGIYFLV